jgi:hypothetical protein
MLFKINQYHTLSYKYKYKYKNTMRLCLAERHACGPNLPSIKLLNLNWIKPIPLHLTKDNLGYVSN